MNPFTRFLRQWTDDKDLHTFIEHCDALESLVVRVYKQGEASAADEAEYQAMRRWLLANYGGWEKALGSYWRVAGAGEGADPIKALLHAERASSFVGDWDAMRHLPVVREALNRLVLKHGGQV